MIASFFYFRLVFIVYWLQNIEMHITNCLLNNVGYMTCNAYDSQIAYNV